MLKKLYTIGTSLVIALGTLHLAFTPCAYNGLTLEAMWFFGSGLAIIFAGFLNLVAARADGKDAVVFALCMATNAAMTALFVAAALFLLREPQVFAGSLLFAFEIVAATALNRMRTRP